MSKKNKLRSFRVNLSLSIGSIIFTLLLIEIILRLFFPVTDYPIDFSFDPELGYIYSPGEEGHVIEGAFGEVFNARYHINAQGWNSPRDYVNEKTEQLRVAVIGDSFVEALQVDVDKAFPELFEQSVNNTPICSPIEVYRFGLGGAPLSHYVKLMQYAAREYHPDLYIVNLYADDFNRSLIENSQTRSHFWTITLNEDGLYEFVPPRSVDINETGLAIDHLIATRRYITWNLQVWQLYPWPDQPLPDPEVYDPLIRFLLGEMQQLVQEEQATLLVTMEPDRVSQIYGEEPVFPEVEVYQPLVEQITTEMEIPYLDLGPAFQEDYAVNHKRFEFKSNIHWNEYGHQVVAEAITDWWIDHECTTQ